MVGIRNFVSISSLTGECAAQKFKTFGVLVYGHVQGVLGHLETLGTLRQTWFDTEIILRFLRHLVNGTKTNQFPFSTLFLMAVGHF